MTRGCDARQLVEGIGLRQRLSCSCRDEVAERLPPPTARVGQAEPFDVDAYLRQGVAASLAGEHATARRIFEALLLPIANAEIDLGQGMRPGR